MLSRLHLVPERYGQTDGQTDSFAISISRISILSCWRAIKNKSIGDDTKAAACQSPTALRNHKKNKIWRKMIFNMADRILTPCSVTPSWHLISPGDCTLQCGMWLWNHDSEFTKWQHPAVWQVTLAWHSIQLAKTSAILEFYFWFRFRHIAAVDRSFCTSLRNFIQIGPPSAEKLTSCRVSRRRISAILDFMGQIMGSLKSACTTSYRSSIKCLVFEKIVFLHFADREIDRRTDEQPVAWSRSRCRERRLKKPSCRRETARCFVSLNISLSHSRSLTVIRNDILE